LAVTKLRPATRPFLVPDTLQRGLALQIQPSGYRVYKLIYRFHNRRVGSTSVLPMRLPSVMLSLRDIPCSQQAREFLHGQDPKRT
jgi:hypothetical protein